MFAGKTTAAFAVATLTLGASLMTAFASSPEERAREAAGWLVNEQYQALWDASTPEMQKRASAEDWKTKAGPAVKALGKLIEFGTAKASQAGGNTVVILP